MFQTSNVTTKLDSVVHSINRRRRMQQIAADSAARSDAAQVTDIPTFEDQKAFAASMIEPSIRSLDPTNEELMAIEAERGLLGTIADDFESVVVFGKTFIQDALATANLLSGVARQDPAAALALGQGSSLIGLGPASKGADEATIQMNEFLRDKFGFVQEPQTAEELRTFSRGAALVGGTLVAGVVAGPVSAVGTAVTGRLGGGIAARGAGRAVTGFGDGLAFAGAFGALRPLNLGEQNRSDALMHDLVVFPLFTAGLGAVVGVGGGLIAKSKANAERAFASREGQEALKQQLSDLGVALERRGASQPVPGEGIVGREWAAQHAAGVSSAGPAQAGVVGKMQELSAGFADKVFTRFAELKTMDGKLWASAMQVADSRTLGRLVGLRSSQLVLAGLNETERRILGLGLVTGRGREITNRLQRNLQHALETDGPIIMNGRTYTADDLRIMIDNVKIGSMSKADRLLFDNSPKIQNALKLYNENVLPLLTELRTRNGLQTLVFPDVPFLPLVPVSPSKEAIRALEKKLGRKATVDELATLMEEGTFIRMGTTPERAAAPSSVPTGTPFRTSRTPGANRAFGGAPFYSIDLKQILSHTFERDFGVDRKNNLLGEMLRRDYALEVEEGTAGRIVLRGTDEAAPSTVVVNTPKGPREVELELIEVLGNPMLLHNRFGVHIGDLPPAGRITGSAERVIEGGRPSGAPQIGGPKLLAPPGLGEVALRQGEAVVPRRELIGPRRPGAGAPDPQRALPSPASGGELMNVEFRAGEGFSDFLAGAVQSEPVLGKFLVPKPVAEAFRGVTTNPNRGVGNTVVDQMGGTPVFTAYERFMNLNTQLLLSSPVELFAHWSRILSTLVSFPGVGDDLGKMATAANRLIPFIGPRITGTISMFKTYSTAADLRLEGRIAEAVGLPTRAFQSDRVEGFFAKLGEPGRKLEHATEFGRTILFDLPETAILEPGLRRNLLDKIKGIDMRARMVATKALETRLGREATTEEIAQHLMRFGAYNEALQTNLVTFLRKAKFNPFAAGQQGFIRGEIQKLYGNLGLPPATLEELGAETVRAMKAEMLWRGIGGTAVALMMGNYMLSGKWPWENQTNHRLDIDTGFRDQNGRPWYIKFTSVAPDLARATRITGARLMVELAGDDAAPAGIGVDVLRQVRNDVITYGFSSPGLQATTALATGSTLFATEQLGGGTQPLNLIPPQPTDAQVLKERFFLTAGAANPTVEMFLGIGEVEGKPIIPRALSQLNLKLTLGKEPVSEFTSEVRTQRARVFEVVQDRVSRAWKKYPDPTQRGQRLRVYIEEARAFPPEQRQMALENMMRSDATRVRGHASSLGRTIIGEPFR